MKNSITKRGPQQDIRDSKKDIEKMQTEEVTMDLPEVKDIPGQEFIHPPKMKAFADTTVSSDDEEGKGIPGLDDEEADVTAEEADLLERSSDSQAGPEDDALRKATLDNTDED